MEHGAAGDQVFAMRIGGPQEMQHRQQSSGIAVEHGQLGIVLAGRCGEKLGIAVGVRHCVDGLGAPRIVLQPITHQVQHVLESLFDA